MSGNSAGDFLDRYLDYLDGDYTIDHQEGSNRDRIVSPDELAALIKLKREEETLTRRRTRNVFRSVVD